MSQVRAEVREGGETPGGPTGGHLVWYFSESTLAAARIGDYKYVFIDLPDGWFGPKVKLDWPGIYNLRLDPFEKMNLNESLFAANWWAFEFWRFVFVQQEVAKLAQTALDFPPMQPGGSFNLSGVKDKIEKAMSDRAVNQEICIAEPWLKMDLSKCRPFGRQAD